MGQQLHGSPMSEFYLDSNGLSVSSVLNFKLMEVASKCHLYEFS